MQLITILGQTCSGKTQMSLDLFRLLQSSGKSTWIVNCDSRQIYRDLDYGTAKIEGVWEDGIYYVEGDIPHYLIDYVEPAVQYNLSKYLQDFANLFDKPDKNPDYVILVGGTGLWAKAIEHKMDLGLIQTQYQEDYDYRKKELTLLSINELQSLIKSWNIELNQSDIANKIRLVSNILRTEAINNSWIQDFVYPKFYSQHYFAIKIENQEDLKQKIKNRVLTRMNQGLLSETKQLLKVLDQARVLAFGLEYSLTVQYILNRITTDQWLEQLSNVNWQYAKRQMTWLRKEKTLVWVKGLDEIVKELEL